MKTFFSPLALSLLFITSFLFVHAQERTVEFEPAMDPHPFSDYLNWTPEEGTLCEPEYSSGCGMGDGFTSFAVEEISNYNSGCEDLNGNGWSQYLDLGPAILFPGFTHDFIMETGYDNQLVTIWVDFNDDFDLTSDEIILFDYELENSGDLYTAEVEIPSDAAPGMHYMRIRTNWQGSCSDPCDGYNYGEAEDYFVMIGAAEFGIVEGYVTELDGGAPVEDAVVSLNGLIDLDYTTGADGYFLFDYVFVGDYSISCEKQGYNEQSADLTVEEDITYTQDFQLTHPTISVDPLSLSAVLPLGGITSDYAVIENNGDGPLNWAASMQIIGEKKKAVYDLQFEYPVAQGGGEAGIETDGNYIYTTKWNGGAILKYDLNGEFLESFNISGVSGLRDLAYDGTYFYGSAAIPLVWEMDFDSQELISSFTAPTSVRAIAYNEDEDVFYANNFSSDIVKFDKTGADLGSFEVGPYGEDYYGFAYDAVSAGGPYLWGYAGTGDSQNEIIQLQLPSGNETGFILDVADKLTGPVYNTAGGLYTQPNLVFGKWTLGGLVQNEVIWGLELADAQTWLWVGPNAGTLSAESSEDLEIQFDASDLEAGEYYAEILFTSFPEVGNPVIEVSLIVAEDITAPCDINNIVNCTDVELIWSVCPAESSVADSFYVYRDDMKIETVFDTAYLDLFLLPEETYHYKITAFYNGIETVPSTSVEVDVLLPENLEPLNLHVEIDGNDISLACDPPSGCLSPPMYNLYQDGSLFDSNPEGVFQINWEVHEYYTTAQYYFGESDPSNTILITGVDESTAPAINIFPNPVSNELTIGNRNREDLTLRVLDHFGKRVITMQGNDSELTIDVSHLEPGVYFVVIITEKDETVRKIIVL